MILSKKNRKNYKAKGLRKNIAHDHLRLYNNFRLECVDSKGTSFERAGVTSHCSAICYNYMDQLTRNL